MQAQKIRQLLRERGLGQVRVGTVDDYQGQEERIIFISTVRPCPHAVHRDRVCHWVSGQLAYYALPRC